jgi:hypothetical protein
VYQRGSKVRRSANILDRERGTAEAFLSRRGVQVAARRKKEGFQVIDAKAS